MQGKVVIAGIGQTEFGRHEGRTTYSLNAEAARKALADAGIDKDCVDGLFVKFPTSNFEFMYGQKLAEALGIVPRIGGVWDQGGAANASLVGYAAMAIEAGQCDIALVTFADNPKSGTRQAYQRPWGNDEVHGWFGVPAGYAMIAQRHMQQYGTRPEDLAAVPQGRQARAHTRLWSGTDLMGGQPAPRSDDHSGQSLGGDSVRGGGADTGRY